MLAELRAVLSCGYKQTVASEFDFCAVSGTITGIIGANGSGKTTLLKTLAGIIPPVTGNVFIDDKDVHRMNARFRAQKIAMVFSGVSTLFGLTVEQIVQMGRYPHRDGFSALSKSDSAVCSKWIEACRIENLAHRQFNTLSSGEAQRVVLAKSLCQNPDVLLLDEPFSNMDIKYQHYFLETIADLKKHYIICIILHDISQVFRYCDNILMIHENKQYFYGSCSKGFDEELLQTVFDTKLSCRMIDGKRLVI